MRTIILFSAALALAGCAASASTTYSRPSPSDRASVARPPPGPNIYAVAPRATVHSDLIACNHATGSNIGEVGYRYESLAYTPYITTPAGALLRNPTEGACLSSGFGWRGSASGGGRAHNGLDLANPNGGFIYAAADGVVRFAEYRGGYGNVVEIDHGRGVRTLYAHLSEIDQNLREGDFVYGGAAIARMGMSGNATGVHLHYEVWVDGQLVDPLNYGRPPVYVSAPAPADARIPDNISTWEASAPPAEVITTVDDVAPKNEALPSDAFVLPPPTH